MFIEITELKPVDEQIRLIFNGNVTEPNDDSRVKIYYTVNDSNERLDETDPDILVDIKQIIGNLNFGNQSDGLSISVNFDTIKSKWKISCSSVQRVSGMIFPHEVEINLDDMHIHVLFNVYR